jgi:hypothetical protein
MKKILFIFIALVTSVTIQSQTGTKNDTTRKGSEEIQTLFTKTGKIGWWLRADFALTSCDSRDIVPGGMSGGIIINHFFPTGLDDYVIMNS